MQHAQKKAIIHTLIEAKRPDLATEVSRIAAAATEDHHPKVIAKAIIDALKQVKVKAKIVELRGSTLDGGTFKGAKPTAPIRGWDGSVVVILEADDGSGPYKVFFQMQWSNEGEYSGHVSADAPRGTIPLNRYSSLAQFLSNGLSSVKDWLGK